MAKKLRIRTLRLEKLPYGKYNFVAFIKQKSPNVKYSGPNGKYVTPIRDILSNSASGNWRLGHALNYKKNKVYTKVYLTNKIDLALLKMCCPHLFYKIYEIKLKEITSEEI